MTVQELIDALQALPEHKKLLDVNVFDEEAGHVPVESVELCNCYGAFVGLKESGRLEQEEDDAFIGAED
jgi:hypothetical protein